MKRSIVRGLLRLYPAKWRNEYGAELENVLLAERLRFTMILNVVRSAMGQQVRISSHPAGLFRSLGLMIAALGAVFLLSIFVSFPLWRLITMPMAAALAHSGRAPLSVQRKPWEAFAIILLWLPLLVTAFVSYPAILCLVRMKLASTWAPRQKRFDAFAMWSGSLYLLSGVSALVAWQQGMVLTLGGFEPLVRATSISTVSDCFERFTRSILEFGILCQIPVLAYFLVGVWKNSLRAVIK